MSATAQFKQVTNILRGVAEKMARVEGDTGVKDAAQYWCDQFTAASDEAAAAVAENHGPEDGSDEGKSE